MPVVDYIKETFDKEIALLPIPTTAIVGQNSSMLPPNLAANQIKPADFDLEKLQELSKKERPPLIPRTQEIQNQELPQT